VKINSRRVSLGPGSQDGSEKAAYNLKGKTKDGLPVGGKKKKRGVLKESWKEERSQERVNAQKR